MEWWLWALIGLGLAGCEMLTPGGFYFLFFGIGALITSGLVWVGAAGPAWTQWLLFTVISVACLVPLRARLVRWAAGDGPRAVDSIVGEEAVLLDDLEPGGIGKAELRGTTWSVRALGTRTFRRGERARVARVDGLTLWVDA
jgi:inner membrane protein